MNQVASLIVRLLRLLSASRCQPMLAFTAACLLAREQYPLSNFPMYSSFTARTFYVYLADGEGAPIPALTAFGMNTATLKKVFVAETHREAERSDAQSKRVTYEQKQAAGERLLLRLRNSPARSGNVELPAVLRLYEVTVSTAGGRFDKQTVMIAEAR